MGIINTLTASSIAIIYNILVHYIISMSVTDLGYYEVINRSIIILIISSVVAILGSSKSIPVFKDKPIIKTGLKYASILLLITVFIISIPGTNIKSDTKMLLLVVAFIVIVYYYTKIDNKEENIEKDKDEDII